MRRLGFLIPCLAILLTACNEEVMTGPSELDSTQTGMVTFTLSADMRNDVVQVKSSTEEIPVDEFWVEIFNASQTRIFCEKYVDAKDTTLFLNSGEYSLLATYGLENGVGFDKPFYKAEKDFTVGPQEITDLSLTAKLANVKVAVKFDENLGNKLSYDEYWAVVRNNGKKLRFNPKETRAGYIPAGELEFVLVVKINGEYRQYVHPAATYNPNDFVTFDVKAGLLDGNVTIKVLVDDTVEMIEVEEVEVPVENILPIEEPMIFSQGFDGENTIRYTEGKAEHLGEVWISAAAEGVISSATLSLDCDALGLPASVDLVNADASVIASLEAKGIWWKFNDDKTSLAISLTDAYNDHFAKIGYVGYDATAQKCLPVAQIGLSIEAASGHVKSAEDSFTVIAEPNAATGAFSWNDYDVWAWKIVDPKLTLGEGSFNKTKIQYSLDGSSWNDLQTVTSANHLMGTIEGLTPGTTYHLRAMYDGWLEVAPSVNFTTESAQQVGNAGFEEWTDGIITYKSTGGTIGGGNHDIEWYEPESWWATNGRTSMSSGGNGWVSNYYIKSCPCAASSIDYTSEPYSAHIYVVCVGETASDSTHDPIIVGPAPKYVGELFIGESNDDGSVKSTGHAFSSRPSGLKFKYKYIPNGSEVFQVTCRIEGAEGEIASATVNGSSSSAWKEMSVPINYTDVSQFASKIFISFKATTSSEPGITDKKTFELGGTNRTTHMGSSLRIDDVELVY